MIAATKGRDSWWGLKGQDLCWNCGQPRQGDWAQTQTGIFAKPEVKDQVVRSPSRTVALRLLIGYGPVVSSENVQALTHRGGAFWVGGESLKKGIKIKQGGKDVAPVQYKKGKGHQGCACTQERPCEGTARRQPPTSPRERPWEQQTLLVPWAWGSRLQNCEKIDLCCSSHPVCGVLLWQPKQTNTPFSSYRAPGRQNCCVWKKKTDPRNMGRDSRTCHPWCRGVNKVLTQVKLNTSKIEINQPKIPTVESIWMYCSRRGKNVNCSGRICFGRNTDPRKRRKELSKICLYRIIK